MYDSCIRPGRILVTVRDIVVGRPYMSTVIGLCGGIVVTDSAVYSVSSEGHGLLDSNWVVGAEHL